MAVIGILVCYYPDYKYRASVTLKKILNKISQDNKLIIINNAPLPLSSQSDYEISGENIGWEFGAWDLGIDYIKGTVQSDDIIILANDTFCSNREFTIFDLWLFYRAFLKIKENNRLLVGEKCQLPKEFNIDGYCTNSWISSYLLGMSYSSLKKIHPVNNSFFIKSDVIDFENKKITIPNLSRSLNEHLSQWLFPNDYQHGWYKAKLGSVNEVLWYHKLHAIYNEKMLSAKAMKNNMQLYDVYGNAILKNISKIFRKCKVNKVKG